MLLCHRLSLMIPIPPRSADFAIETPHKWKWTSYARLKSFLCNYKYLYLKLRHPVNKEIEIETSLISWS